MTGIASAKGVEPMASDMRQKFTDLYNRLLILRERRTNVYTKYEADFAQRLRQYKKPWQKIESDLDVRVKGASLDLWELDCIRRPLFKAAQEELRFLRSEINAIEHDMNQIAKTLLPVPGTKWLRLKTVHGSTYRSQGYGANAYAKNAAEIIAMEAGAVVEAKVVTIPTERPKFPSYHYVHTDNYEVQVLVDSEVDLELVRRRPPMGLRDWMKACWSKGMNPRVYNPFLPHGLEQKYGIDYQGRDVR